LAFDAFAIQTEYIKFKDTTSAYVLLMYVKRDFAINKKQATSEK